MTGCFLLQTMVWNSKEGGQLMSSTRAGFWVDEVHSHRNLNSQILKPWQTEPQSAWMMPRTALRRCCSSRRSPRSDFSYAACRNPMPQKKLGRKEGTIKISGMASIALPPFFGWTDVCRGLKTKHDRKSEKRCELRHGAQCCRFRAFCMSFKTESQSSVIIFLRFRLGSVQSVLLHFKLCEMAQSESNFAV